uniref:tRNA(Ile)-lysidine synthase n=1 Tax=Erythroglossum lusitanicum TaxID=2575615 RepID=A0A4D6WS94_9FLOR|nr:tRNA Ile-lysidine synthetase [Erythroglossum lusitanicum]
MNKNSNKYIFNTIKKHKISSILIAISGGQDSIYLTDLIKNLKSQCNINQIEYIYVDHQWKIDSVKQIEHIINYLKPSKNNLNIYQIKKIILSENLSRIYRYHTIINHAIKYKYSIILTGHSQTDKLETFLLNLTRGTSLEGATSLTLHRKLNYNIHIIRPIINSNRSNINWYCRKFSLPNWSDTTNNYYTMQRNRVRYELMPYLRKYFNINIEKNLNIFLKTCFNDNEYIKQNTIKLYLNIRHNRYIAINLSYTNQQHISIKYRILQLFFYHNFCILLNNNMLI